MQVTHIYKIRTTIRSFIHDYEIHKLVFYSALYYQNHRRMRSYLLDADKD